MLVDFHELGPSYRATQPEGVRRWLENVRASQAPDRRPGSALRNRITYALLETIKSPTLLIAGDADLYAPPSVMRLLFARVKQSEFTIVPEAGHSAYWEQPDIFNDRVLNFIRKH